MVTGVRRVLFRSPQSQSQPQPQSQPQSQPQKSPWKLPLPRIPQKEQQEKNQNTMQMANNEIKKTGSWRQGNKNNETEKKKEDPGRYPQNNNLQTTKSTNTGTNTGTSTNTKPTWRK